MLLTKTTVKDALKSTMSKTQIIIINRAITATTTVWDCWKCHYGSRWIRSCV